LTRRTTHLLRTASPRFLPSFQPTAPQTTKSVRTPSDSV
jgi:hypothetical protein